MRVLIPICVMGRLFIWLQYTIDAPKMVENLCKVFCMKKYGEGSLETSAAAQQTNCLSKGIVDKVDLRLGHKQPKLQKQCDRQRVPQQPRCLMAVDPIFSGRNKSR